MPGLPALDVAIGIAFFYLVFSLICTTANEAIAQWLNKRPKTLEEAIQQLLGNADLKDAVLNHPLICNLSRTKRKDGKQTTQVPSYIPAHAFATALLDRLTGTSALTDMNALASNLRSAAEGNTISLNDKNHIQVPRGTVMALDTLLAKANGDFHRFHDEVEAWYNATMDRATGWYKRYVQKQTYVLAAIIVLWANFDTLQVVRRLWMDPTLRAAVVEQARHRTEQTSSGELPLATYDNPDKPEEGKPIRIENTGATAPLNEQEKVLLGNVTGWAQDLQELRSKLHDENQTGDAEPANRTRWIWTQWALMHVLGWTVSLLAISQGAPFWFDVLNRFMNLRNAGRPPDEKRAKNAGDAAVEA
jgi:hypothetical protein